MKTAQHIECSECSTLWKPHASALTCWPYAVLTLCVPTSGSCSITNQHAEPQDLTPLVAFESTILRCNLRRRHFQVS